MKADLSSERKNYLIRKIKEKCLTTQVVRFTVHRCPPDGRCEPRNVEPEQLQKC
jgi:hypothetical protein